MKPEAARELIANNVVKLLYSWRLVNGFLRCVLDHVRQDPQNLCRQDLHCLTIPEMVRPPGKGPPQTRALGPFINCGPFAL